MMFDDDDDDVGMQVDWGAESQTCRAGPLCLDLDAKPKMPCESGGGGTSVWCGDWAAIRKKCNSIRFRRF